MNDTLPQQDTNLTFDSLSLSEKTMQALELANYHQPSPIQAAFIPEALTGKDVIGQAQTGTGKTAAFLLPMFEALDQFETGDARDQTSPFALVLVPTRELAAQVCEEGKILSTGRKLRFQVLCGGKPIKPQINQLSKGVDIVVGTPGRVLDHITRQSMNLSKLKVVVLDEADRMLDVGFRPDIIKILSKSPKKRQTLLLSATLPPAVSRLAERFMQSPTTLNLSPKNISVKAIELFYVTVEPHHKLSTLQEVFRKLQPEQTIIFCRTKRTTEQVAKKLKQDGLRKVAALNGDMSQRMRDKVMEGFRDGRLKYLVATDVVGRGIDVSTVSHIINYDIPEFCDDYVHRVGRTGRMGKTGVSLTFVTKDQGPQLTNIEMHINRLLEPCKLIELPEPPPRKEEVVDDSFEAELLEESNDTPQPSARPKRKRANRSNKNRSNQKQSGKKSAAKKSTQKSTQKATPARKESPVGKDSQQGSEQDGGNSNGQPKKKRPRKRRSKKKTGETNEVNVSAGNASSEKSAAASQQEAPAKKKATKKNPAKRKYSSRKKTTPADSSQNS